MYPVGIMNTFYEVTMIIKYNSEVINIIIHVDSYLILHDLPIISNLLSSIK
jgi:hypothetical protein